MTELGRITEEERRQAGYRSGCRRSSCTLVFAVSASMRRTCIPVFARETARLAAVRLLPSIGPGGHHVDLCFRLHAQSQVCLQGSISFHYGGR